MGLQNRHLGFIPFVVEWSPFQAWTSEAPSAFRRGITKPETRPDPRTVSHVDVLASWVLMDEASSFKPSKKFERSGTALADAGSEIVGDR